MLNIMTPSIIWKYNYLEFKIKQVESAFYICFYYKFDSKFDRLGKLGRMCLQVSPIEVSS